LINIIQQRINKQKAQRFSIVVLIVIIMVFPGFKQAYNQDRATNTYLEKALQAAAWIDSSAVQVPGGSKVWPADPRALHTVDNTLYTGNPGVILFFLEAYYSTGKKQYLNNACEGANYLLAALAHEKEMGLYTGISGIGFVLWEVFKAAKKEKYREGVRQCINSIQNSAKRVGEGIQWNSSTDIIYGSAGIGLFLVTMAKEFKDPALYDLAAAAGKRLLELGIQAKDGLKWRMTPDFQRLMPNFSHGTAGIAYFLATLYKETKKKEFLEGALAGASYLLSVAKTGEDTCLIFHHEPGGEDLYYLGWCHGPVGTARLFYRLYQVTGDKNWMAWVKKSANGIMHSGIPEKQTPGFWNNVGRCCGSAGVAEFFLDLYRITNDKKYIAFSKKMTHHLLKNATPGEKGLKWFQAEHRVRPDFLVAQTGLMQGAAGIGLWLLKLVAFEKGKKEKISFPDSPHGMGDL
jgi:lantibiotic modifying enzyme